MVVVVYVVAVYENCSTGIGFADEAFNLKGNVFNFRKEYGKNEYIDMMNIFGRILYLTEFSNFLSYVNFEKIDFLPLIAIIGTLKMSLLP